MEVDESSPAGLTTSRSSSIGSGGGSGSGSGSVEYTSLRDMLLEGGGGEHHHHHHHHGGGGRGGSGCRELSCTDNIHEFDASNIGIRNQLLKHAASAYLQSAVVVAGARDDDYSCCLGRLWRQMVQLRSGGGGGGARGRVLLRACTWQGCVDDPAERCAAFLARSARRIAAFFTGIWTT